MDEISAKIDEEGFDNAASIWFGLRFTVEGLQQYTVSNLEQIHQRIKGKCQTHICRVNCGRRYGRSFNKWCSACMFWKTELHSLNRYRSHWDRVKWNEIDTSDFDQSYEEMSKVFIEGFNTAKRGVLQDIGTLLSLFRNMEVFKINNQILEDIKQNRNYLFAHNYSTNTFDIEKRTCLENLMKLLRVPEVQRTQNAIDALKLIHVLYSRSGILRNYFRKQQDRSLQVAIRDQASLDSEETNEMNRLEDVLHRHSGEIKTLIARSTRSGIPYRGPKSLKHFAFTIICSLLIGYGCWKSSNEKNSPQDKTKTDGSDDEVEDVPNVDGKMNIFRCSGCLSMRFDEYWNEDVYLNIDYHVEILHNESYIDRKWLVQLVIEELVSSDKGVILVADIGYGKSSIISNIVCAEQSSSWYALRRIVLAYHFCRYDSSQSTISANFIKLLAGAIVKYYPELGNAILSDRKATGILYDSQCEKDPVNCLEIAILAPLNNRWNNYQFLVLIDGLDECDTGAKGSLIDLLNRKLQGFPSNVKFLFTSRHIESVIYKFKQMKVIHLDSDRFNFDNMNDITIYIRHASQLSLSKNEISLLTNAASGKFLHVKYYLQYCLETNICDFEKIPDELETIYQLNLDRIFEGESSLFEDCRSVFEVLCATTMTLNVEQVIRIANITSRESRRKVELLLGNKLRHFLRITSNEVSFVHKSISDFLTNTSRKYLPYFIQKEIGHKLISAYFLKSLNQSENSNLVEIVHHVALSGEPKYQSELLQQTVKIKANTNKPMTSYLHDTVRKFNSYNTTCLMLRLIKVQYIDTADQRNMSSAFIAAAHGHDESLKCLLNHGANLNFKVIFSSISFYHGQELVFLCKHFYFCGYNILHVSSQNGHLEIVKAILRTNESLSESQTDMGLNALQLAAENGHVHIAEFFLKFNRDFADILSLHHASQNGHFKMVKLLLRYGVKDECLPCNGSFYWMPLISNRQQQMIKIPKIQNILTYEWVELKVHFHDDWHLVTCDTALNAAVRNGHLQTVKILLEQDKNALQCTAFDGKTPIMTAIQFNRIDIFQYLLGFKSILQTPCKQISYWKTEEWKLSISERVLLNKDRCPNGASLIHLIAIYDHFEMLLLLHRKGFNNFEERDEELITPLHYAFCRSSYKFIYRVKLLGANFDVRASNGSTPYHSAALCGSPALYYMMDQDKNFIIPDVVDNEGRSILHYALSYSYSQDHISNVHVYTQFLVAIDSNHDIYRVDSTNRNCLHYAAKEGHSFAFSYAIEFLKPYGFNKLITQKDAFGLTPFEEMFHSMPKRQSTEPIRIPTNCRMQDIFYTWCNTNITYLLSPHERCILNVAINLKNSNGFKKMNIGNLVRLSLHKSRIYPVLVLKVYATNHFDRAVLQTPDLINTVANYEGPHLAEFILTDTSALNCTGGISPLHQIVINFRNTNWQYANLAFLDKFLKHKSAAFLDTCFDKYGYNLLHRSVMGGNIIATRYLVEKGMKIKQESNKKESMIVLSILKTPYLHDGDLPPYYSNSSRLYFLSYLLHNQSHLITRTDKGVVNFDETATHILNVTFLSSKSDRKQLKHSLCPSGEQQLGLVHIAAAKGLIMFLRRSKSLFGVDILKCSDSNNITPYYLAHIYNQNKITSWLDSFVRDKMQPGPEHESLLLFGIVSNYKRNRIYDWTCRLQFSVRFPQIFRITMKKCIHREHESSIVTVNAQQSMIIPTVLLTLSFLNSFTEHEAYSTIKSCGEIYIADVCSESVQISNLRKHSFRNIYNSATNQVQKIMMFGTSDSLFVFQNLFTRHDIRRKYLKTLSFRSTFSLRYKYLNKLAIDESLHTDWLRHTAKQEITEQRIFNFSTYVKYETQLALRIYQDIRLRNFDNKIRKMKSRSDTTELQKAADMIRDVAFGWDEINTLAKLLRFESEITASYGSEMTLRFIADALKNYEMPKKVVTLPFVLKYLKIAKPKCHRILKVMKQIQEKKFSPALRMIRSTSEAIVNIKL